MHFTVKFVPLIDTLDTSTFRAKSMVLFEIKSFKNTSDKSMVWSSGPSCSSPAFPPLQSMLELGKTLDHCVVILHGQTICVAYIVNHIINIVQYTGCKLSTLLTALPVSAKDTTGAVSMSELISDFRIEMGQVSDYEIWLEPKVWAGSPNECRTFYAIG